MTIAGPETRWQKFRKTTALFDLGAGVVTFGASIPAAYRFFSAGDARWGWFVIAMAALALALQCGKAHRTYQQQVRKDSVHELQGCLHALETVRHTSKLGYSQRSRSCFMDIGRLVTTTPSSSRWSAVMRSRSRERRS
jgi:hypothetical protein